MNICLIYSVARRRAAGALAVATAAVALASPGDANAQTARMNYLDGQTQIIQASDVRTAADLRPGYVGQVPAEFGKLAPGAISQAVGTVVGDPALANASEIMQVGFGSCNSCQSSSCNGGCGGSFSSSYNACASANACGIPCDPYRYVIVEGLFMERDGGSSFSLTPNVPMSDFDFEWAPRITIGSLPNCVNGYEASFTGIFEWDRGSTVSDAGNGINPSNGATIPDQFEPFFDSDLHVQRYTSEYYSMEASRTLVGWDVAKVLLGARYVNLDEEYFLDGRSLDVARLSSITENNLIGGQIGLDLLYPVAKHAYTDVRMRAGAYANFADSDIQVVRTIGGVPNLETRNSPDDVELAGVFEFGTGVRYQLGESLSVRAGGELWYITGVATATDQIGAPIGRGLLDDIDVDDDIFFYGLTVGAELRF